MCFRQPPDRIAWASPPSDMFTTSSAYKLIVSCDSTPIAGSSNLDNQRKFWKGLWQLWVPNKIKFFVWRACNDALPTMENLHRRHITPSDRCELCKEHSEDAVHALWLCKEISNVWSSLEWFHQAVLIQPASFCELLSRFLHCRDEYRAEIFVIVAWIIWNRRN